MIEKQAQIKQAAADLKQTLLNVSEEHLENQKIAVHNAMVAAGHNDQPKRYKSAAFRRLIRETDSLIELAMTGD